MKSIDEAEFRERFAEILNQARQQSIVIRRDGRDFAAVVSTADYDRLRSASIRAFLDLRSVVAEEAAANGLSEDELRLLLRDDT